MGGAGGGSRGNLRENLDELAGPITASVRFLSENANFCCPLFAKGLMDK